MSSSFFTRRPPRLRLPPRIGAAAFLGLCLAFPGAAQPAGSTHSLRDALNAAWALRPEAQAAAHERTALGARASASRSLIADSPSIGIAHRTDRANSNAGLREYEAELALPLWNPGVRAATQRDVEADRLRYERRHTLARLTLSGELRVQAGAMAQARIERDLAVRRRSDLAALASDVTRRVKAGESARVDSLVADSAVLNADAQVAAFDDAVSRLQQNWRALTGLAGEPALSETLPPENAAASHPATDAAEADVQAAHAGLALAQADRRDPMELGIGMTREREAFGGGSDTSLRVALRIPLGGERRNAPRLAAAEARLATAEAEAQAARRRVQADISAAQSTLATARRSEAFATQRARLAGESQALIARSHQLGEADLPTRLRFDAERFDAELSLARARIDLQRAVSQLNQALGLLP